MTNHEAGIPPGDYTSSTRTSSAPTWQILAEFILPGEPDSERLALEKVTKAVQGLNLSAAHLEQIKSTVAEAILNAIQPGHRYRADLPVVIRVLVSEKTSVVRVTDQGSSPICKPDRPDPAGQQTLAGWSFFLIEKMMDELGGPDNETFHTIELFLYLEGGQNEA